MKLLIIGHAGHGKGTVAEMLGLPHISSSLFFCNMRGYSLREFREDRAAAFNKIAAFNASDPARLAKLLLAKYDVYDGMRGMDEYFSSHYLFDLKIWVEAGERVPAESSESNQLSSYLADITIENNDDKSILEQKINRLRKVLNI